MGGRGTGGGSQLPCMRRWDRAQSKLTNTQEMAFVGENLKPGTFWIADCDHLTLSSMWPLCSITQPTKRLSGYFRPSWRVEREAEVRNGVGRGAYLLLFS